jgi:vacuolar-type H+-ATPase subunit F/Vma7
MSYQDKYGITQIKDGDHNNLSLSVDDMGNGKVPILLFIPDKNKPDHDHIVLTRENAATMLVWLQHYLQDTTV